MLRPFNLGAVNGCVPKISEPAHHTYYYSPEQQPVAKWIAFKQADEIEPVEGFGQVAKMGWLNVGPTNGGKPLDPVQMLMFSGKNTI